MCVSHTWVKMKCSSMILLLFAFFGQCIVCSSQIVRCTTVRVNNGRSRVRGRGRIIRYNCFDGFTLVGNKYSTCVRGQWDTPIPVCVKSGCPAPPAQEHLMVASKLSGAILMFFCEPGYSLTGSAEIYCDGRQWNGTIPYCKNTNVTAPTKCDFESSDLCWWEQDPQHDFDWKRHNFETPSLHIGTGPTHDHTLGIGNDGHYLYIEASGRLENDTARIISPLYNSSLTESGCFSFWYHMYGATIGSLNIYFKQEDAAPRLIFTKSGEQGNQWFHGIANLPKANASFQITIEGVRGPNYLSDIAIDDVAILQGEECIVKNESTSVTVGDDDQVEVVNAQQTCRDRCVSWESVVPMPPRPKSLKSEEFGPESCHCTIDCVERSICCPDYAEYCILGYSTALDSVTGSPSKTTTPKYSALTGFPINPKDNIDPGMSNSTTSTTMRRSTITTTTAKVQTKKPSPRTTPARTTPAKPTQQVETKETPFLSEITSTKHIELQDRPDIHNVEQNPEKVKQGRGIETLEIVAAVGATLVVLSVALAIVIIVIRRRKTYKRGASGSALSEDSDVRFLTSDEILDFNLARPTDNDEM
ncbi:PREDICTED: MAM and LDL-receptor class A domain-containing protein 1-like isoform X2 [Vollenhovia emeryi]|uniref:MAM and LDL-receptor class A domain-containing protein 1-like isoform X2 n=1 Tax=Vollenhovia emeryi TaxID=411798 RepID=UPI0005F58344|nr:PREDICTED: MAM and LDL-receptor class A domain-containing protein 1-like isoform X2 [Vollenhovia emeryi]